MDEHNDRLTDEFLESLRGIKPAEPNPFFYTKLKGRMQHQYQDRVSFSKPGWVIGMLLFFLAINTWMIIIQEVNTKQQTAEKKSPAQVFAETYNLNSDSNY